MRGDGEKRKKANESESCLETVLTVSTCRGGGGENSCTEEEKEEEVTREFPFGD